MQNDNGFLQQRTLMNVLMVKSSNEHLICKQAVSDMAELVSWHIAG